MKLALLLPELPSVTVSSLIESVGKGAGGSTVTTTLAGSLETVPSLTTSWKVRLVAAEGAVKVGCAALVLERLTAGPSVCVQV